MNKIKNKYYSKFSFLPKKMSNGNWVWFKKYHEAYLSTPFVATWFIIRRLESEDYMIEIIKGDIVDDIEQHKVYRFGSASELTKHVRYGQLQ